MKKILSIPILAFSVSLFCARLLSAQTPPEPECWDDSHCAVQANNAIAGDWILLGMLNTSLNTYSMPGFLGDESIEHASNLTLPSSWTLNSNPINQFASYFSLKVPLYQYLPASWNPDNAIPISINTTALNPTVGFTIMLVVNPFMLTAQPATYASIPLTTGTSYQVVNLGVGPQGTWSLGRYFVNPNVPAGTQNSAFWQNPWDTAVAKNGAQQAVFYTFTPDGKCRIDVFTFNSGSDWEAATLDMGFPAATLPVLASPVNNPATGIMNFPASVTMGNPLSFALQPAAMAGNNLQELAIFDSPLLPEEIAGFVNSRVGGNFHYNYLPCNTGYMLVPPGNTDYVSPPTPCGYTSNWTRTK
jgi:hypothetical protein